MEIQSRVFTGKILSPSVDNSSIDNYRKKATEDTEEKFKNKDISYVKISSLDDLEVAKEIKQLEQWQAHVVAHEQMHMLAGGGLVGAPSYTYTYGPDGKKYIKGGEVTFYVPKGIALEDGERAIRKLKAAATAPSDPSPQDLKAAAMASSLETSLKNSIVKKQIQKAYEHSKVSYIEQQEKKDEYISPISKMIFQEFSSFELFI